MSVGSDAPWDHKTHSTSSVVGYSTGYPSTGTVPSNVLARDPRVCEPMGWEVCVERRSKKVTVNLIITRMPDAVKYVLDCTTVQPYTVPYSMNMSDHSGVLSGV